MSFHESDGSAKQLVKDFWNRNVCHVSFIRAAEAGSKEFFEEAEAIRYRYHYYLEPLFDQMAKEYPGGQLLEIGCSMGTDLLQLARRGLQVTGIDLTEAGIELARRRFDLFEKKAVLQVADAETLPYPDETFDLVYSFGVLHHTPETQRAIDEALRVLKPGGLAVVMLYHRHSLNYLVHRVLRHPFDGSRRDPCPIERAYTRSEVLEMFKAFRPVEIRVEYLFGTGWRQFNSIIPRPLHRALGRLWGWHLLIRAYKGPGRWTAR